MNVQHDPDAHRIGTCVGGAWRYGADSIIVHFPYDQAEVGSISVATAADVTEAVDAAVAVMATKPLHAHQRAKILTSVAQAMIAATDELANLLVLEVGKTIREARGEVSNAVGAIQFAAVESVRIHGETVATDSLPGLERRVAYWNRVPAGPVCGIAPFNAPLNNAAHKIGSSIAAGDAIVFKPASSTPLASARIVEMFIAAGLPDGYLSYVAGRGETVGDQLLREQRFARYLFTGSAAVGKKIRESVGLRPTLLELGSNAPTIVHSDANLANAVDACIRSGYAIAGQVCTSVQRVLVQESVAAEFTEMLAKQVGELIVGDPRLPATDVGPMLTEAAAAGAERLVAESVAAGAHVRVGGGRIGPTVVAPAVLDSVVPEMRVACEEIFSPIIGVMQYGDIDEAIAVANDTPYGLQAGVFTRSLSIAHRTAGRLQYGAVMINDASRLRLPQGPYGGVKQSGTGREGPRFAIEELTDMRLIVIDPDG